MLGYASELYYRVVPVHEFVDWQGAGEPLKRLRIIEVIAHASTGFQRDDVIRPLRQQSRNQAPVDILGMVGSAHRIESGCRKRIQQRFALTLKGLIAGAIECGQGRIAALRQRQFPLLYPPPLQPVQGGARIRQGKCKVKATTANSRQESLGLMAHQQKACVAWRFFQHFEYGIGRARMHCFRGHDADDLSAAAMRSDRNELRERADFLDRDLPAGFFGGRGLLVKRARNRTLFFLAHFEHAQIGMIAHLEKET